MHLPGRLWSMRLMSMRCAASHGNCVDHLTHDTAWWLPVQLWAPQEAMHCGNVMRARWATCIASYNYQERMKNSPSSKLISGTSQIPFRPACSCTEGQDLVSRDTCFPVPIKISLLFCGDKVWELIWRRNEIFWIPSIVIKLGPPSDISVGFILKCNHRCIAFTCT
jgi:hypothetical protein